MYANCSAHKLRVFVCLELPWETRRVKKKAYSGMRVTAFVNDARPGARFSELTPTSSASAEYIKHVATFKLRLFPRPTNQLAGIRDSRKSRSESMHAVNTHLTGTLPLDVHFVVF